MAEQVRLPLREPTSLVGTSAGVWIADRASRSLELFRANDAARVRSVELPRAPVGLAAARGFIVVSLDQGGLAAIGDDGNLLWLDDIIGVAARMAGGTGNVVWISENGDDALLAVGRTGQAGRLTAGNVRHFAVAGDDVIWIAGDFITRRSSADGRDQAAATAPLPSTIGAAVCCANALWLSVPEGLLLVNQRTLVPGPTLSAPEGSARHLICHDGRLAGGTRTVFALNPRADRLVYDVGIKAAAPLRGIAASSTWIWALEADEPMVWIAEFL